MTPSPEPHAALSSTQVSASAPPAAQNPLSEGQYLTELSREIRLGLQEILKLAALSLDTDLGPNQRDYLQQIQAGAQSLLDRAEILVDMTHLQTGAIGLVQIPFNPAVLFTDLTNAIADSVQAQGRRVHLDLANDLPNHNQGDPGRIRQILTILANALLIHLPDVNPCIQMRRLESDDPKLDWVRFSLLDLGQRPDELRRFFAPSAETPETKLSYLDCLQVETCRRLIESMGGRIWIDDQSPTALHIDLPLVRLPTDKTAETAAPWATRWNGKRALIVDDHRETQRTLSYWLKDWGFAVEQASSGIQALELARSQRFDLYLFDSVLPGLDGFTLAQQLKVEGLAEQRALVMLASLGQRGDAERCRSLGIDAFLTKPIPPFELRALLSRVLAPERPAKGPLITRHLLAEHRPHLRILFIEPDPIHQKLAAALFQQAGHDTAIVSDPYTGIACLKTADYDLVFIDLVGLQDPLTGMLAQMTGEPAQTVRQPPIIGMVAPDEQGSEIPELAARISKPLTPLVLEELIRRLIQYPAPG